MKIPNSFYFSFRWKNTLWAFASGMLLGYVSLSMFPYPFAKFISSGKSLLVFLLIFGMGVTIFYQFIVPTYFYGKRRGEFEYAYMEDIFKKRTKEILRSVAGGPTGREVLAINPTELNQKILKIAEREVDQDRKFLIFMTLAMQCIKANEYARIIEYSQEALVYKPNDLVANFILAEAQEHQGEGGGAVKSYEAALQDPMAQSTPLRDFISAQIERVKKDGPRKGSKIQGLRYMTW
ncbi:MAG: hypothetical protein AB1424_16820 [Thermodesulfobacteriota bacterium]